MIQYPGALAISGLRAKENSLRAGYVVAPVPQISAANP